MSFEGGGRVIRAAPANNAAADTASTGLDDASVAHRAVGRRPRDRLVTADTANTAAQLVRVPSPDRAESVKGPAPLADTPPRFEVACARGRLHGKRDRDTDVEHI
jgi:hypothetical protein